MGAVATMIVRIGADVNDLTKGMDKATKAVAKASKEIAALGKEMTLFVTLPIVAAGIGFSKLAADADALGDRLERVFGDKTVKMTEFIAQLRATVPESTMSLDRMAISVQNLALNMGMSRDQAFDMSKGLMQMAADASAFAEVPLEEALQAVERGLMGKGRGLVQFGIFMKDAQVKEEAFRLGLMNTGKELTPLGTAIASYSLMQKGASRITGEAARVADEESTKFKMLKANFIDTGVKLGTVLLPAFGVLLDFLNKTLDVLGKLNPKVIEFVAIVGSIAASIGPIISVIAGVGKLIVLFRGLGAAIAAVRAAGSVSTIFAALTAPEIIAGVIVLAAAVTALVLIWKAFHHEAEKKIDLPKNLNPMGTAGMANGATSFDSDKIKTPFEQLEAKTKAFVDQLQYAKERGQDIVQFYDLAARAQERLTQYAKKGADDVKKKAIDAIRALQPFVDESAFTKMGLGHPAMQIAGLPAAEVLTRLAEKGDLLSGAFENAVKQGGDLTGIFKQTNEFATMLEDIIDSLPDKTNAFAVAAGAAYEKLRPLLMAGEMMGVGGISHRGDSAGHAFNAQAQAAFNFGQDMQQYQNQLRVREAALKLPDAFDAVREAALRVAEEHKRMIRELREAWHEFRSFKLQMQGLETVLGAGVTQLLALISAASIGQKIVDKVTGAVDQFVSNLVSDVTRPVSNWVKGVLGIGHRTGKGPDPLQMLIQGLDFTSTHAASAAQLRQMEATVKLQLAGNLSLAKRITAEERLNQIQQALGETITGVTEALQNAPSGFKIALARFNATAVASGRPDSITEHTRRPSGDMNFYGDLVIQAGSGSRTLKELLQEFAALQRQTNRRGGASPLALAVAGT
jgi:hypothetical protein